MMEQTVEFKYSARYFTHGSRVDCSAIWFVLHGYGQLAQFFLRKFNVLAEHRIYVIAPEALSRFYLEDIDKRMRTGNNRVGATWMTRENRNADIENYIRFLDAVYDNEIKLPNVPVAVLGFSQGAATASRWVTQSQLKFNKLILWSGLFPPDLDLKKSQHVLKGVETVSVHGKSDPFFNDERYAEMSDITSRLHVEVKSISFEGGHDIDSETLMKLV